MPANKLDWFADPKGWNATRGNETLRHYSYRWVAKRSGTFRLIEAPKPKLKQLQRKVLHELLDRVPPHAAAHGFRPGRSILTNAALHCGRAVVIRFDLQDFFPSIPSARVFALFQTLGYPDTVARVLAGLCTSRISAEIWAKRRGVTDPGADHLAWLRFAAPHLPQGAPTSPALANFAAFRLDVRLSALAELLGASYTRYADDLAFSGPIELRTASARMRRLVTEIAAEEGFAVNPRKTRVMARGGRQHVAGVVVNVRPNVSRGEFDTLKAVLTNCARHGPAGQNRENKPDLRAYLAGKIGHVAMLNPIRGRKLWTLFDAIRWDETTKSSTIAG